MNDEIENKMDNTALTNDWQGREEIKRPTEARIPLMDVSHYQKNNA